MKDMSNRRRVQDRLERFTVGATLLTVTAMAVIEAWAEPGAWARSRSGFGEEAGIALGISLIACLVFFFVIPILMGAGRIQPLSMRQPIRELTSADAVDAVSSRMRRLGLEVAVDESGGGLRIVGRSVVGFANPTPAQTRRREVVVEIRREEGGLVGVGRFRYVGFDGSGVDTGEGEFAEATLRFVLGAGPEPTDTMLNAGAWGAMAAALPAAVMVMWSRAGILDPGFGIGGALAGAAFCVGGGLCAAAARFRGTQWASMHLVGAFVLAACGGLVCARAMSSPPPDQQWDGTIHVALCNMHGGDAEQYLNPFAFEDASSTCTEDHDEWTCELLRSWPMRSWALSVATNPFTFAIIMPPFDREELRASSRFDVPTVIDHLDDSNPLVRWVAFDLLSLTSDCAIDIWKRDACPDVGCAGWRAAVIADARAWWGDPDGRPLWDVRLDRARRHDAFAREAIREASSERSHEAWNALRSLLDDPACRDHVLQHAHWSCDPELIPLIVSDYLASDDPERAREGWYLLHHMPGLPNLETPEQWTAWWAAHGDRLVYDEERSRLIVTPEPETDEPKN